MTCWGGTNIEAWTSAERLGQIPAFRKDLNRITNLKINADELAESHRKAVEEWTLNIGKKEGSINTANRALWVQRDFDDASWKSMNLPVFMEDAGLKGFDGHVWFRHDIAEHPVRLDNNPYVPTCLFNAMLKPLVPFAVKGAIWYQDEGNVDRAKQYRDLMPNPINNWCVEWKSDFPFFIVQLANYMKRKDMPG
ncbi:hypothetical protein HMPREF1870_00048 [Bacteroidales bacterium KA00344]|nr:hypothetical protein HMPREF1870_00048 [Bacteroidales bacterium KA00344]